MGGMVGDGKPSQSQATTSSGRVSAATATANKMNTNSGEMDIASVIQEKPGMYAYPYRVQPGK